MAQDSLVVPKGVVYNRASAEENALARANLLRELTPANAGYSLFAGVVFIGPKLWSDLGRNAKAGAIRNGNVTIRVPVLNNGKPVRYEEMTAKVLQTPADFRTVWDLLIKDIRIDSVKIRKPRPEEISYYWSIISFDIKEPVFVIETGKHNILVDMGGKTNQVFWIEAVE